MHSGHAPRVVLGIECRDDFGEQRELKTEQILFPRIQSIESRRTVPVTEIAIKRNSPAGGELLSDVASLGGLASWRDGGLRLASRGELRGTKAEQITARHLREHEPDEAIRPFSAQKLGWTSHATSAQFQRYT